MPLQVFARAGTFSNLQHSVRRSTCASVSWRCWVNSMPNCSDLAALAAGDLEVIGGPCIPHGIVEIDAAASGDGDERVGFRRITTKLHRGEVQSSQGTDDFEMAEFLCPDVHQEILAGGVVAVKTLYGILHGGREFAVGAPELLKEHVAEFRIRLVDPNRIHEPFDVMIHERTLAGVMQNQRAVFGKVPSTWKLDELIVATRGAHNTIAGMEEASDE